MHIYITLEIVHKVEMIPSSACLPTGGIWAQQEAGQRKDRGVNENTTTTSSGQMAPYKDL